MKTQELDLGGAIAFIEMDQVKSWATMEESSPRLYELTIKYKRRKDQVFRFKRKKDFNHAVDQFDEMFVNK